MTNQPIIIISTRELQDGFKVNDISVKWNSNSQEYWTKAVGDDSIDEIAKRVLQAVNGTAVIRI